jgi:hypothetical protein
VSPVKLLSPSGVNSDVTIGATGNATSSKKSPTRKNAAAGFFFATASPKTHATAVRIEMLSAALPSGSPTLDGSHWVAARAIATTQLETMIKEADAFILCVTF